MTTNPYTPTESDQASAPNRSFLSGLMFCLTIFLGLGLMGITAWNAYHNYVFLAANEMGFPPYVIAATLLCLVCGLGFIYSAWRWKSGHVRSAIASMTISGFVFFLGPPLLLQLLA